MTLARKLPRLRPGPCQGSIVAQDRATQAWTRQGAGAPSASVVSAFMDGTRPEADRYAGAGHGAVRQIRLAHLLRDAKYAIEEGCVVFAPGFRLLLWRAMAIGKRRDRDDLFRFVTRRDVPYTNNACERALCPSVIFRKVTGGFRAEWGAKVYAAAASVIATGRLYGLTALAAIRAALAGVPIIRAR